jgi:hypothetical protein
MLSQKVNLLGQVASCGCPGSPPFGTGTLFPYSRKIPPGRLLLPGDLGARWEVADLIAINQDSPAQAEAAGSRKPDICGHLEARGDTTDAKRVGPRAPLFLGRIP